MRLAPSSASRRDLALPLALLAMLAGAGPAAAAFTPQYVLQWGQQGAGNGDFQGPSGVAIDPGTGNVYVTDTGNHRVQVFDGTGTFLFAWGSFGTDSSQFDRPYGIAIDRGAVFVVDANNQRVQRFTMAGNYVLEWARRDPAPDSSSRRAASRSTASATSTSSTRCGTTCRSSTRSERSS